VSVENSFTDAAKAATPTTLDKVLVVFVVGAILFLSEFNVVNVCNSENNRNVNGNSISRSIPSCCSVSGSYVKLKVKINYLLK
jgi:hypothetical protein